jgi:hypothetical protein
MVLMSVFMVPVLYSLVEEVKFLGRSLGDTSSD